MCQFGTNCRSASFLIRDILGADGSDFAAQAKLMGYDQPGGQFFQNYHGQQHPQNQYMGSFGNNQYYTGLQKDYSVDSMVDSRDWTVAIPIPLPVYIRTRSPPGSDSLLKPKKYRRSRTVFTELQLLGLEKRFQSQKYLSTPDRMDMAETLGLTQIQVKTWYQNRRMKLKKQMIHHETTETEQQTLDISTQDLCLNNNELQPIIDDRPRSVNVDAPIGIDIRTHAQSILASDNAKHYHALRTFCPKK